MNPHLPFEDDTPLDRPAGSAEATRLDGAELPAPAEPAALPWGVVGSNSYQRLKPGPGRGIVRTSAGRGVVYQKPPLPPDGLGWTPDGEDQWQMALSLSAGPSQAGSLKDLGVRSLVEFSREVRVLHGAPLRSPQDEERFQLLRQELDLLAERLLLLVEHLHSKGCSVGLFNPESILILGEGPQLRLILPDLGFVRTGEPRGRPPVWFRTDGDFQNQWGPLWEGREPTVQQEIGSFDRPGRGSPTDRVADLKQIARIFAWVLRGEARSDIVSRDEDPSTAAPAWYVLDCVVRGQVVSAQDFVDRLREHPLSQHFLPANHPPRAGTQPASPGWGRLLGYYGAGLAAVAGAALWVFLYIDPPGRSVAATFDPRRQPEQTLPVDSPLRELVQQYQQAQDLDERFQILMRCYGVSKLSWSDSERGVEGHWREHLASQFQEQLRNRLVRIPAEADAEPGALNDRVLEVKTLMGYLTQLLPRNVHPSLIDQEKQCLEQCQLWLERWEVPA